MRESQGDVLTRLLCSLLLALAIDGGIVTLVPRKGAQKNWSQSKTVMADQRGDFAIPNLAPGEHTLVEQTAGKDPAQTESAGGNVYLSENANTAIVVKVAE
jgi:hypothetical protein